MTVKSILKRSLDLLPMKAHLVQMGAGLHPRFKTTHTLRFFSMISGRCNPAALPPALVSNLGISAHYRLQFPVKTNPVYLYGKPEHYAGERGALFLSKHFANKCDAFVDIGAHRGYFLFFLAAHAQRQIPLFYFEPNQELFDEIGRNLHANGISNAIGSTLAVGKSTGRTKFFLDLSDNSSSSLTNDFEAVHRLKEIEVDTVSFDDFVRTNNLHNLCVKVDIENAEFEFLEGASEEHGRIRYLIMEILGPAVGKGFITTLKRAFNMEAYYMNDFHLEHSPDGNFRYIPPQYNWLFCRETPSELQATLASSGFSVRAATR